MLAGGLVLAAQQRSFYQQTEYKGQAIGKLTGDIYYARMDDYVSVLLVTRAEATSGARHQVLPLG